MPWQQVIGPVCQDIAKSLRRSPADSDVPDLSCCSYIAQASTTLQRAIGALEACVIHDLLLPTAGSSAQIQEALGKLEVTVGMRLHPSMLAEVACRAITCTVTPSCRMACIGLKPPASQRVLVQDLITCSFWSFQVISPDYHTLLLVLKMSVSL